MSATLPTTNFLVTGEAPVRAATIRSERVRTGTLSTALWSVAAGLLGAAAAIGVTTAVVQNVVLPIHI